LTKADELFERDGGHLVRLLLQHGGDAEEVAVRGMVNDDDLLIFVDGGDFGATGEHNIAVLGRIAGFEDALARRELCDLNLGGEDAGFIVIEQFKKRDVA
jgi:hypothetical protein